MAVRRLLGKAVVTATLGTGLVLGISPALAQALPVSPYNQQAKTICYWDGKAYSPGGKTTFQGEVYVCQADGTWKKEGKVVSPTLAMQVYSR